MKKLLLPLILFSSITYGADCSKHPIYCQIKKNSPKINKKYAMKVSNVIYKMHKKYHIPTRIFTAILRQENNYTLKTNGCHKGLIKNPNIDSEVQSCLNPPIGLAPEDDCIVNIKRYKEIRVCSDFGISQIYFKTAQKFGIDIGKLNTDLEYSIEAGAIVLADFMNRYEAKDNDWWLRYNCGTRSSTKRDTCQIYKKLVERYL